MDTRTIDRELEAMAREEIENEVKQEEWPEIIPIDEYSNLPEFPSQIIPTPGHEMIEAVAEVNQVSRGMSGSIYLAVLSSCLGGKGFINLETHTEPLNLFICPVAGPGERKSSTIKIMTDPIYEYQQFKQEEMKDEIIKASTEHKTKEQRLAYLQKKAARIDDETERRDLQAEAVEISKEMNDNPVPMEPLFIVDDVTSEKLGVLLADHCERMSVISAEGGLFGIMAGRYDVKGGPNIDIYLKGHAGDPYSNHRIGREAKTISNPALTMCLMAQHDVIQEIGGNRRFRGRGLLARFNYVVCKPQAGHRTRQKKIIDNRLQQDYSKFIKGLMGISCHGAELTMSHEASALWDQFLNDIESDMLPGGSLVSMQDWGSKLAGTVARIAGLLHFAEYEAAAVNKPISAGIVGASCAIGSYFKEHALAAFGLMKTDPKMESAKHILDYIRRHKCSTFKGRDILNNKNAFKTMDDVNQGIKILIERGYIRELPPEVGKPGRPQSMQYEVNEKLYSYKNHQQ